MISLTNILKIGYYLLETRTNFYISLYILIFVSNKFWIEIKIPTGLIFFVYLKSYFQFILQKNVLTFLLNLIIFYIPCWSGLKPVRHPIKKGIKLLFLFPVRLPAINKEIPINCKIMDSLFFILAI